MGARRVDAKAHLRQLVERGLQGAFGDPSGATFETGCQVDGSKREIGQIIAHIAQAGRGRAGTHVIDSADRRTAVEVFLPDRIELLIEDPAAASDPHTPVVDRERQGRVLQVVTVEDIRYATVGHPGRAVYGDLVHGRAWRKRHDNAGNALHRATEAGHGATVLREVVQGFAVDHAQQFRHAPGILADQPRHDQPARRVAQRESDPRIRDRDLSQPFAAVFAHQADDPELGGRHRRDAGGSGPDGLLARPAHGVYVNSFDLHREVG